LGRVYDSQKKEKSKVQWELKSQHDYPLPFEGPLQLDVTFFMYIPNGLSKKIGGGEGGVPHYIRPDIDNLLKWILDCSNKILYNDDAQVTTVIARKIYSKLPRTEFSITRLEIL
jgi:Holliday junction resolvase RusA-like endonuclease